MSRISEVAVGPVSIGEGRPLALLAGPCVIESERHTIRLAEAIREICARLNFPFIFKASFDKANRSSIESYRGPGLDEGLRILVKTRDAIDGPVVTDIHEASQAQPVGEVLDLIQIPAFLCRQTDLLAAAAKTGKPVNAKKGQILSPEEMKNVVDKIKANGNEQVLLTERGTFFGYHRLVNDMTSIPRMRALAPVVFDATHSCQMPGSLGFQSGGDREYAATLAQAAVAAGADAIFIEVHDDPDNAMSDPATVWPLDQLEALLRRCQAIKAAVCGTG